ncbi:MAG TPA: polyphosphate kinase 1 [Chitinophagaceae bacterium]|nr:polyphosphate kinase 1 [Chitinophagaceae bacterium]
MASRKRKAITRDISWLSFNARVLQEARDPAVPLYERIRFLGIFSNNLDEFFRIRVATLKRMLVFGKAAKVHLEQNPGKILAGIQQTVIQQQLEFSRIWREIMSVLRQSRIFIRTEKQLNREQQKFVTNYFNEEVRPNIIPLMIEGIVQFPVLRDKSIYLAVVLARKDQSVRDKYALIEVPTAELSRFIILPGKPEERNIMLLEDLIRFNLPNLFSYFAYDRFSAHVIKVTRDAELDIDNDIATDIIQELEKGLKNRKKGKPVRFVYDRQIDPHLLEYLIRRLSLTRKDNLIPGDRIHNFKDFMDFPEQVFPERNTRKKNLFHPLLLNAPSILQVIQKQDILLNFPYHAFNSLVDLLREAAIDPHVTSIKITLYRLAKNSRIVNALINAARNGKQVVAQLELRARFDEEANMLWKMRLEEEGVKVHIGIPGMKVHCKICVIKKRIGNQTLQFGFVCTGNLNERTSSYYSDHCLMTANRNIIADINRIFSYLENPRHDEKLLESCKTLLVSPPAMRKGFIRLINREIRNAKNKKQASIILKLNSLADQELIRKLNEAGKAGVDIRLIIRGICCMLTQNRKWKRQIQAISIIDEYLEHARICVFHNGGNAKVYLSSADWMVRNLDHRLEIATPVFDLRIRQELVDILHIQLNDNVKARVLDDAQTNQYRPRTGRRIRSQSETYHYLAHKKYEQD